MTDIEVAHRDAVTVLTLDRPDVLNAVRSSTIAQLGSAFVALRERAEAGSTRALVITGRGVAFCAGQDLHELEQLDAAADVDHRALLNAFQHVTAVLLDLPILTIAAINGVAVGFGAELAVNCDVRLASPDARIGFVEATRALFPTNGVTWLLPRIVGHGTASELLLTGELVAAAEAERIGLVNRVVDRDLDVVTHALAMAERVAANAPRSVRGIKAALRRSWTASFEQMVEVETEGMLATYGTTDLAEGNRAFLEKRPPRYVGH